MKPKETNVGWKKNIDKLLFVIASLYLIVALTWMWKHQQKSSVTPHNSQSLPSENNQTPTPNQNQSLPSPSTQQAQSPAKIKSSPSLAQEIIEVNPVAVSQPNLPLPVPQLPSPLPTITIPEPPSIQVQTTTPLPVRIPPQPTPQKYSPPAAKINQVPIIETANQENLISANQIPDYTTNPSATSAIEKINEKQNTLVGIVQLQNNSIALFNLNNLTERVEVGSPIGTTGWILVSVNGTQAVINNRQNKSLHLTVGEKF
jgi:hypothetical protein